MTFSFWDNKDLWIIFLINFQMSKSVDNFYNFPQMSKFLTMFWVVQGEGHVNSGPLSVVTMTLNEHRWVRQSIVQGQEDVGRCNQARVVTPRGHQQALVLLSGVDKE
jgi:hypothetical protein